MEQGLFKSFSAMGACRNIQFIAFDTMQQIKKLKTQTYRTLLEKSAFCRRGRLQTGYGENIICHMSANGFRAGHRGKP